MTFLFSHFSDYQQSVGLKQRLSCKDTSVGSLPLSLLHPTTKYACFLSLACSGLSSQGSVSFSMTSCFDVTMPGPKVVSVMCSGNWNLFFRCTLIYHLCTLSKRSVASWVWSFSPAKAEADACLVGRLCSDLVSGTRALVWQPSM